LYIDPSWTMIAPRWVTCGAGAQFREALGLLASGWPDRMRVRYRATGRHRFGLLDGPGGPFCVTSGRNRRVTRSSRWSSAGKVLAGTTVCPTLGLSLKGYPERAHAPRVVHMKGCYKSMSNAGREAMAVHSRHDWSERLDPSARLGWALDQSGAGGHGIVSGVQVTSSRGQVSAVNAGDPRSPIATGTQPGVRWPWSCTSRALSFASSQRSEQSIAFRRPLLKRSVGQQRMRFTRQCA
jgi:hypothetical protein